MYYLLYEEETKEYTIVDFENNLWINSDGNWSYSVKEVIKNAHDYGFNSEDIDYVNDNAPIMKDYKNISDYCKALENHSSCINCVCLGPISLNIKTAIKQYPEYFV